MTPLQLSIQRPGRRPPTARTARLIAGAIALPMALFAAGGASAQQGKVKATHGAWQLNCGNPPGKKEEKCALVQSVTAEDRPNVGLTVIFLKTVDGKKRLLRVVAPLGVLLPAGLGLKIDNKDIGQVPFIKCGRVGCISEVVVKDELVEALSSGKQAIFIIFQTPDAGIGIPVSLNGFKAGLGAIK